MDTIVGAGVTIGIGIIVIAAIYQLGKGSNPIVNDLVGGPNAAYQTTLSSLFK
jgi:hypothetical protein